MPKIPRDITGKELARLLVRLGYSFVRQTGSHTRLEAKLAHRVHAITIPAHDPVKIGTLGSILNEVAEAQQMSKPDLLRILFQ